MGHRVFPLATDSGQLSSIDRPLSQVTTSEMPVMRRSTRELPPDAFVLTTTIPDDDAAKRRSRGSLIALMFLLVFLGGAMWWVYRTAEQVVVPRQPSTPASAPISP